MGIFRLRPARQEVPEDTRIVVDLDRLAAEPVGFRWKGQIHQIKPMTTERFLKACNEWSALTSMAGKPDIDQKRVVDGFSRLFSACCDTLTRADVYEMTLAQRGALIQQIFEIISGRAFSEKKNMTNQEMPAS